MVIEPRRCLEGSPRGMLAGTQAAKTTDAVPIFKPIVIEDFPIHLRHAQGSGTLGPWTLRTLNQFGFELEDLLIE